MKMQAGSVLQTVELCNDRTTKNTTIKFFDVQKHFDSLFANVQLADDVTNAMIKMTDKIIEDKKSDHMVKVLLVL